MRVTGLANINEKSLGPKSLATLDAGWWQKGKGGKRKACEMPEPRSPMASFAQSVQNVIDGPITWFRETIVEPNQEKYNWYHQRFRRVPTIDQCYVDDAVCRFEADQQFRRDRMVDNEIVNILRQRFEDCTLYEAPDHIVKCKPLLEQYEKATENWFIKYGDLGGYANAKTAYMKQKHRLIWERRHGPVGSGMKGEEAVH